MRAAPRSSLSLLCCQILVLCTATSRTRLLRDSEIEHLGNRHIHPATYRKWVRVTILWLASDAQMLGTNTFVAFPVFSCISDDSIAYKKAIGIKKRDGTMEINVLNRSIPIHCDGLYLFSLEGTITLPRAPHELILRVYCQPQEPLLEVNCSEENTKVKEVFVHEFRSQEAVYLEAHPNNTENNEALTLDLNLNLIMLTPRSYCRPEN
uniref:TNF family profile domain-containing protein n=1 Tax=Podarcis muralis TaxID=64176 RepID=A0A670IHK7_PODMU